MTSVAKKQAAIISLLLIAGLVFFLAIQMLIARYNVRLAWLAISGFGLGYGALLAYGLGLIDTKLTAAYIYLGLPLIVAILGFGRPGAIGAAIILAVVLWAAYDSIRGELLNRLEFSVWRAFTGGSKWILTGLIVAVLGLALPFLSSSSFIGQFKLSPANTELIMRPFTGLIMSILPGYTSSATVDDLIKRQSLATPGASAPSVQQIAVVRTELSQRFHQPLSGTETVPEVTSQIVNQKIDVVKESNPILGVVIFILSAILLSRLLIPFLSLLVRLLISLIHFAATRLGISAVTNEQTMVERLTL